ncbi:MAG: hypothetical protein ACREBK_06045 [Sphingomicrobium sp.]
MTGRNIDLYAALARQLRTDSIRCSTAAGSGGWHGKALDGCGRGR